MTFSCPNAEVNIRHNRRAHASASYALPIENSLTPFDQGKKKPGFNVVNILKEYLLQQISLSHSQ